MTTNNHLIRAQKWAKRGAAVAVLALSGALLGSCGGGGVSSSTGSQVGDLTLIPGSGSLYANVPFEFTIAGGRQPYQVSTSEQTLVANQSVNGNKFIVVPNNPGVVDPQTDPNIVPSRSIRFTVRDNAGTTIVTGDTSFRVIQNFFTGYNISVLSTSSCGLTATGGGQAPTVEACVGFESIVDLRPTTAGRLFNNRPLRFTINFGQFLFIDKNSSPPNQAVSSITLTTTGATSPGGSEGGQLRAFFAPLSGASSQFASMRITDVQSGVYRDVDFVINRPSSGPIALVPATLGPLQGRDSASCGTGQVNVRVTGGTPPYRATVSNGLSSVSVNPSSIADPTGAFTIGVGPTSPPNCLNEPNAVIVTDAAGATANFGITTQPGTTAPATALDVVPRDLGCIANNAGGLTFNATIAVIGGNNLKVVNSSNAALLTATPSSVTGTGTVTIASVGTAGATATPVTITVADGANQIQVSASRKATCP